MSNISNLAAAEWVKSSFSGNGGSNCVEWVPGHAAAHGTVPVRDSKLPDDAPVLLVTPSAWTSLLHHLRATR
jgi:hypothetical protein